MGDVVIATSILPVFKKAFPEAKIGMLVGSWALQVIKGHPQIEWIHVVDHWKINRAKKNIFSKYKNYIKTAKEALKEIKKINYDVAVDLYSFFPNNIPLLYRAGIPVRIGYKSGGFGPLLTHALDWQPGKHEAEYHADLLRFLGITKFDSLKPNLPPVSPKAEKELADFLTLYDLKKKSYIVMHPGAGSKIKEWPVEKWRELLNLLEPQNKKIIITGVASENELIEKIISGFPNCINACGKLSWQGFVALIKNALFLYSVDSVAGHIAAAVDTPGIIIASGINDMNRWRPYNKLIKVISNNIPCAPCFKNSGCSNMICLNEIMIREVFHFGVPENEN